MLPSGEQVESHPIPTEKSIKADADMDDTNLVTHILEAESTS